MDGIFYLIAVIIVCGSLLLVWQLTKGKEEEKRKLQMERDKKVIALCDYLMSEPNYESEVKKDESVHQEL